MDLRAAQGLLAERLLQRPFHDLRPGHQDLAAFPGHDREMRGDQTRGRQTGDGAEGRGGDRHRPHGPCHRLEARSVEHRAADCLGAAARAGDTAAAALVQPDQRQQVLQRQLLGVDALAQSRFVGRAAAQREILAADDTRPVIYLAEPEHEIGRRETFQAAVLGPLGGAGARADLAERSGIEQAGDALADRQAALGMMARHALGAALFQRKFPLAAYFIDLVVPGHGQSPIGFWLCCVVGPGVDIGGETA